MNLGPEVVVLALVEDDRFRLLCLPFGEAEDVVVVVVVVVEIAGTAAVAVAVGCFLPTSSTSSSHGCLRSCSSNAARALSSCAIVCSCNDGTAAVAAKAAATKPYR